MKEILYTEEEVKNLIKNACFMSGVTLFKNFDKWFEQSKKLKADEQQ